MIRVSFDFDGTLRDKEQVQALAIQLSSNVNIECWIITRRTNKGKSWGEVFEFADSLEIPQERVIFTEGQYKAPTLIEKGIDIHIDDDPTELIFFALGTEHRVLCIARPEWEKEFWSYVEELREIHKK